MTSLQGITVLFFAAPLYEDLELWYPRLRMEEEGWKVVTTRGPSPDEWNDLRFAWAAVAAAPVKAAARQGRPRSRSTRQRLVSARGGDWPGG